MFASYAILPSKIRPPVRRADGLVRTRLLEPLFENSEKKLQLLIAPAGYGKTTLLVDLAETPPFALTWLTLDPADRDPRSFIEYIVAALRVRFPSVGTATLTALRTATDVGSRAASFARTLAVDVVTNVPEVCILVLDDFHEVNDSTAVTSFLDELLRLLPENLRVVISGRTLPNVTVSRLAVDHNLFGVGEAELRFTAHEVQELFRRRYRTELGDEQAAQLATQSEGWIAGLLLSAHGLWDGLMDSLIAERGARGPLYDYLTDEAYSRQPPEMRQFLLSSSVPREINTATCAALLGPGPWMEQLEHVERANLFVVRLGGSPPVFRYHQLFREFLQARFRREQPAEFRALHLATARLMVARRDWPAALEHFGDADESAEAADLIARVAPELEQGGRWYLLIRAIDALPSSVREGNGRLLVARARAAAVTGDAKSSEDAARRALAVTTSPDQRSLRAWAFQSLGNALRLLGRIEDAVDALTAARTLAPDDDALQAMVRRDMGMSLGVRGDWHGAARELLGAQQFFEQAGNAGEAASAGFALGMVYARIGRVHEATIVYERVLERWRALGDDANAAFALNNLGYLRVLQGDYDDARRMLVDGLDTAKRAGNHRAEAALEHSLGVLLLSTGDLDAAREAFQRGLAAAEAVSDLWSIATASEGLGLCALWRGNARESEDWFGRGAALADRQQSEYLRALISIDQSLVSLYAGRPADAIPMMTAGRATLAKLNARRDLVRTDAWLAQALQTRGDSAAAAEHFRDALREASNLELPALLDLPARWNTALFASLPGGEFAAVRDAVLKRVGRTHRETAVRPHGRAPQPLPRLVVRSFGRGQVALPGSAVVEWGREKSRELFFYLLHNGPTASERIIADIWPELTAAKGRAGLYSATYTLRRLIHAEALRVSGRVYTVPGTLIAEHDAAEFDRLVSVATTLDAFEAVHALRDAVTCYGGPLLDDMHAEWVGPLRHEYESRALCALDALVVRAAELDDWRTSVRAAERALQIEPRDELYQWAIRGYMQLGERASAMRLVRAARRQAADYDVALSGELESLAQLVGRMSE